MKTLNPLTIICIVKENIRRASESYANAAIKNNALGRNLFEQLSEFERFHYDRLTALVESLEEQYHFVNYERREFVLPPIIGRNFIEDPAHQSLMQIISDALKFDKRLEKTLTDLVAKLAGSHGQRLFIRLSEEEHKNHSVLLDAFWSLNQTGVWRWSRPELRKVKETARFAINLPASGSTSGH